MDVTICKFWRISAQRTPLIHSVTWVNRRAVSQRLRGAETILDLINFPQTPGAASYESSC